MSSTLDPPENWKPKRIGRREGCIGVKTQEGTSRTLTVPGGPARLAASGGWAKSIKAAEKTMKKKQRKGRAPGGQGAAWGEARVPQREGEGDTERERPDPHSSVEALNPATPRPLLAPGPPLTA